MKKAILFFAVIISFFGYAQNDVLFNKATEAYNKGEFSDAIINYEKILANGEHSAELYYNLGNAHYKLNHIAPSIYNYEKALLLSPNDSEIKNNLSYARNMTLDAIEKLPETSLRSFYKKVTGIFTFDQWAYTAIVFVVLFVLTYILFRFLRYATQKRISFILSLFFLLLCIVSVVFAFVTLSDYNKDAPAIVFAEESVVQAEPNNRSEAVFRLHEGTKVTVLEQLNDWQKIELADGKTGWIASEDIKLIKN